MVNRKNLIAVGSHEPDGMEAATAADDSIVRTEHDGPRYDADDNVPTYSEETYSEIEGKGWIMPVVALLLIAGWTGFFGFVHGTAMMAATPAQWAQWIVDWSVPVLLVAVLWLLAMRNSRREAVRFTRVAHALSQESAQLEHRLITVNRELSLARDFIAAQSRDLESLGRVASERLSVHAQELQGLISTNGDQVENIARVSTTARDNMAHLRDGLPVIANSARDVASQIAHAGNVAQGHVDSLVSGFGRLNDFGEASERQVTSLRNRVDDALATFRAQADDMAQIVDRRFTELEQQNHTFRADLDGHEAESLASIRRRADVLRDELAQRQRDQAAQELAAVAALHQRIAQLRDETGAIMAEISAGQSNAAARWNHTVEDLQARLVDAIGHVAEVDEKAMADARQRLAALKDEAARVDAILAERLDAFDTGLAERSAHMSEKEVRAINLLRDRLAGIDSEITERQQEHLAHVAGLAERGTAMSARLGELAQEMEQIATKGHSAGATMEATTSALVQRLNEAAHALEQRRQAIARLTDDSVRLLELIRSSADHGSQELPRSLEEAESRLVSFRADVNNLNAMIEQAGARTAALANDLGSIREDGSATAQQLNLMQQRLSQIVSESAQLADRTRGELSSAIAALEDASVRQLARITEGQAEEVRNLADGIAARSSAAISDAVQIHAGGAIAELRESAEQALASGREAAAVLREQLASVSELTGNLEQRVAHARSRAQEQVDNDFSRRMALITESLNSASIDITRAFDTEVTDAAWAGYLRGDRGIFTRRAIRLMDNHEIREISDLYETDAPFRETVNRYIHDFEAMLRSILSTRDGNALAVTLLSSDMGKLYVVLAQSIERLRD